MKQMNKHSKGLYLCVSVSMCRYREQTGDCQRGGKWGEDRNWCGRPRGTKFQLHNK